MIDFLKLHTKEVEIVNYFQNHSELDWCKDVSQLNFDRETISSKTIHTWRGIAFEFHQNSLNVLFRPHYFFNQNRHNANQFTVIECINVLQQFIDVFQFDASKFVIQNIEFGVNVESPIDIKNLVSWIKYHSKNEFRNHVGLPYSKESYRVTSQHRANNYKIIKAYAKGLQFPEYCSTNTFRFEVKSKKSKFINGKLNATTLADLLKPMIYAKMAETILKEFDNVLILDHRKVQRNLSKRKYARLKDYSNVDVWTKYLYQNRNSFNKHFKKYYSLLDEIGINLHSEVRKIILDKLETLKRGCNFSTMKKNGVGAYSHIYKGGNCNHLRVCKVTGLDISMQRSNSTMLSHSGIKYYREHEPQTYNWLCEKYLSSNWIDSDTPTKIKELAHNIRNHDSNTRLRQRKLYPKRQANILDALVYHCYN